MSEKNSARMRLCPKCANSIEEDAAKCAYCKADLSSDDAPHWLKRDALSPEPPGGAKGGKRFPISSKLLWPAAMLVAVLLAFFAGGYTKRSELMLAAQANLKQLQAKDQIIQSQEAQIAQTRQQLNENSAQLAELKTKLEESQKEFSAVKQRLGTATREVDRLNASRSAATSRTASRAPDTSAPPPPPRAARGTADPGVYETTEATPVYENPSSSSRVVSQIGRGTRIHVVSSAGQWLEVRSTRGNPPGYVRAGDARPIGRAN
jgi:hypothetical protein